MNRGVETVTRMLVLAVMLVIVFSIFCLPAWAGNRMSAFPSVLSSGKATDLPDVPDKTDDEDLTRIITYVAGAAVVIAVIVVIRKLTGKEDDREIKIEVLKVIERVIKEILIAIPENIELRNDKTNLFEIGFPY